VSEEESNKVTDEEIEDYLRREKERPLTEEAVDNLVESMAEYNSTDPEEIKKRAAKAGMTTHEYGKRIMHESLKELRKSLRDSEIDYELMRRKLQELPAAANFPGFMSTMNNLKGIIDRERKNVRECEEELRKA
jgi:Glu-tRNA(Gln) amidotransferase subunit E-like FAD-binding protein